ncbi:MAG TPA: methyltransferase domain-containing protein [Micromonosporaceae bacterium]|nr:methyltransferase domain-containing protein [Micromonosporaceae bacterium]
MSEDAERPDLHDLKAAAASTYSATADNFDADALSFWDRYGRETVRRAGLRPGDRVVDACCGTGASALPAAHAVGPTGHVLGLDIAEPALALARAKAAEQHLDNVEFRTADIEDTGLPPASRDAVVCVFGIFFLPDMARGIAELWRLVRPGGLLAVTFWGPGWMEPGDTAFWEAVSTERPDLVRGFQPWTRVTDGASIRALFRDGDAAEPEVEEEAGVHGMATPDDWWTVVLGTGYRATVQRLDPDAAARVRAASVSRLRRDGVSELQANVVYARARKASA